MQLFDEDYRQAKNFTNGTHRARSPAETLTAYRPLMPSMGITRLANVTGLDYIGVPVYVCVRPNSRALAISQGKGLDDDAARASALMESIEIWHAERVDAPLRLDSLRSLRSSQRVVIDVDRLPLRRPPIVTSVYMPWIEGFDLVRKVRTWLPFDIVDLNTTRPKSPFFINSSNGLSSGNHVLEAIVHAMCELIERDGTTLWMMDAGDPLGDKKLVDPSTVDDPGCLEVIAKIRAAGLYLGVQDITSDIGIPSYQCFVTEPPGALRAVGDHWGMGCHLSPGIALLRALTEAVQARLTYIAGSRDDIFNHDFRARRNPEHAELLYHIATRTQHPLTFQARRSLATDSFEGDIEVLCQALRGVGLDSVVVVVLTKPELKIPVVKVLIPGLEKGPEEGGPPGPRARAVAGGGL